MTTGKHHIESGHQYDYLFRQPEGGFVEVQKYADLSDTVGLMQEVIQTTLGDTKELAKLLKAKTPYETLSNVWNFTFKHLQYEKDAVNIEQVRRPARSWRDRSKGVDCDCLTVFIGSVLTNLEIPFLIRLTRYGNAESFGHVYPVAILSNQEVVMDCVVHQFNYEEPYKSKKDVQMKLQYLNGIDDKELEPTYLFGSFDIPEDAESLMLLDDDDLEGLEGRDERLQRRTDRKEKREERRESKPPLNERIKEGFHAINKVNPATALLRAGVLASMKLNIGHVAGKLRYSYWTPTEATNRNMQPGKHAQLIQIREKLEKVFYGAGGEPRNLKKSILEGKGNKDKLVPLSGFHSSLYGVDYNDLESVIGSDTFQEEFSEVQGNVQGLGEIVSTTAAIASASGIIGTIVGLLKKLGSLFKKGSPEDQREIIADTTAEADNKAIMESIANETQNLPEIATGASLPAAPQVADFSELEQKIKTIPASERESDDDDQSKSDPKTTGGFMGWIKDHPIQSALIGVVIVGGGIWAYKAYQDKKKKGKSKALSGVKSKKVKGKKTTTQRVEKVRLL